MDAGRALPGLGHMLICVWVDEQIPLPHRRTESQRPRLAVCA